jgi:hypothetical protein
MENIIFEGIEFYPIPNYLSYYASRCGKIYSGKTGIIMKTRVRKEGYEVICLGGGIKNLRLYPTVHSLIASSFLGERPQGYDIDHKDFIRTNNNVDNLQYLTRVENLKRSYQNRKFIKVFEYDLDGSFLAEYDSIAELSRIRGLDPTYLKRVLEGKKRTAKGRFYSTEKLEYAKPRDSKTYRSVYMCDLNGQIIKKFDTIKDASNYSGAGSSEIIKCCKGFSKTAGGYIFRYT